MKKIVNYLTNDVVIIAPSRADRPNDFSFYEKKVNNSNSRNNSECPFCRENEDKLEGILYRNDNCIILKNKYPALVSHLSSHEVIIDSIEHNIQFKKLSIEEIKSVFYGIIEREKIHITSKATKCIQVFKNYGHYAGASLKHSHMQMLAIEYVPDRIKVISDNMSKFKEENDKCYICSLKEGVDIHTFYENNTFKAMTKVDSLMSYTVDIVPKRHIEVLSKMDDIEIGDLSIAIKTSLQAIDKIIPNFSYNMMFYISPKDSNGNLNKDFHFFIQIVPRIFSFGGFEIATRNYITSVCPKEYSEQLKKEIEFECS